MQHLSALHNVSLFGCKVKNSSAKIKQLPVGVQLGIDDGIVTIQ